MKSLLIVALFGLLSTGIAHAGVGSSQRMDKKYFEVSSVTVQEVVPTAQELYLTGLDFEELQQQQQDLGVTPSDLSDVGVVLDQMIVIGRKVVEILKAGQSVVDIKRDATAVVPFGVKEWGQLAGWKVPVTKVLQVQVKNFYGMTMIDMRLKVSAMYGGNFKGKGNFLSNVILVPSTVVTQWGFNLDLWTESRAPVNMGSNQDPIAGLGMDIRYKVKTLITEINGTADYFVTGKGEILPLP